MIKKLLVISFLIGHISQGEMTTLDLLGSSYALSLTNHSLMEPHVFFVVGLPNETVTTWYPLINKIFRQKQSTINEQIASSQTHVSPRIASSISNLLVICTESSKPSQYEQLLENELGLTLAEGEKVLTSDDVTLIESAMKDINIACLPFTLEPSIASTIHSSNLTSAIELLIKLCDRVINLRGSNWWTKIFTTIKPKDIEGFGLSVLLIAAFSKQFKNQLNSTFDEQIKPFEQYFSPILLHGIGGIGNSITVEIFLRNKLEKQSLSLIYITLAKIIGISLKDVEGQGLHPVGINSFSRGNNLLHIALESGHLENIKKLIDENVDNNAQNSLGLTPLMLFVNNCPFRDSSNSLKILKLLLSKKPNLELKDYKKGMTALHWAAGWCPDFVESLVKAGAKKNAKDNNHDQPRDLAMKRKQPKEIVTLLT
jgi:Ankyrin repeats (3 copies)